MKTPRVAVVYFSQTGNTRKVAESIAEGLSGSGAHAEVLDLLETDAGTLGAYDMIGIGTPVFYFREPILVEQFIRKLPGCDQKPAFVFLTSGGHPSNTFFHMEHGLSNQGYLVVDGYACHGYDVYPPFKGQDRFLGHPNAEELAGARTFGGQLMQRSQKIQQGNTDLIPEFKRHWDRFGRLSMVFRNRLLTWLILPRKRLVVDRCTRCGLCAKQCPVGVIELSKGVEAGAEGGYPVVKRGCIYCTMCERVCPEEAIQCDWRFIMQRMQEPPEGAQVG